MKKNHCRHCWPTRRKYHIGPYSNYLFSAFQEKITGLKPGFLDELTEKLWEILLSVLSLIKIVSLEEKPDHSQLRNRSLIFWKEAQKRGIEVKQVKFLGKPTNYFKTKKGYYEAIPLTINQNKFNFDDKFKIKRLLEKEDFPVPSGKHFIRTKKALNFAKELGFPLVVKPRFGSLSEHATWNIKNKKQLKQAIKIAKQYQPGFIMEEYIKGSLFRATVLKDKVFVCKKERANVIGNGSSTIKELVQGKNNSPQRGATHQKNTTLHEIPINERLNRNLSEQGLTLNSIPDKNQKVYLHNKIILSQGCDIIEVTDQTHPENKELFRKATKSLQTNLAGFDFITPDIATAYHQLKTGIIEANSLPYADMHQFPSKGKSQPVAKTCWDKTEELQQESAGGGI